MYGWAILWSKCDSFPLADWYLWWKLCSFVGLTAFWGCTTSCWLLLALNFIGKVYFDRNICWLNWQRLFNRYTKVKFHWQFVDWQLDRLLVFCNSCTDQNFCKILHTNINRLEGNLCSRNVQRFEKRIFYSYVKYENLISCWSWRLSKQRFCILLWGLFCQTNTLLRNSALEFKGMQPLILNILNFRLIFGWFGLGQM